MITNSKFRWCTFNVENFNRRVSYLTDVPMDLLDCFLSYFEDNVGICTFDEEGSEFSLVLTTGYSYILCEEKDIENIKTSIPDLAKELLSDIKRDMDAWVSWEPRYEDYTEKEILNRKIELKRKMSELEKELIFYEANLELKTL